MLPNKYVNNDGLVTFDIHIVDPETGSVGRTTRTAQLVSEKHSDRQIWTDQTLDVRLQ